MHAVFPRHLSRMRNLVVLSLAAALGCVSICGLPTFAADSSPTPASASDTLGFKCDFEASSSLPAGWTCEGAAVIDTVQAFGGKRFLTLSRAPEEAGQPCSATAPAFKITPGVWKIGVACKSNLNSPDESFNGVVVLQYLSGGKVLDQLTVANIYGQHGWALTSNPFEPPAGADSARVQVRINKAIGKFSVDDISISRVSATVPKKNPIDRVVFSHGEHWNFLYPGDSRAFKVSVETLTPLPADQLTTTCVVTDYWGSEQGAPLKVQVTQTPDLRNGRTVYEGTADFGKYPLEIGKYYEIHAEIPRGKAEPFRNYTSFVIEPEAAANSYKPSEVPFTSRNWDGRNRDTVEMAHRMGIRIMGLWSGWDAAPPYAPYAPCLDLVQKYGMGAVFGTPVGLIETRQEDWEKYDEKCLREGVRNLIQKYRKTVEPFIICMGNEPPVRMDWIPTDIQAYKAVYEEAKKTDPSVFVLGTSIGNVSEEFFKQGFGQYCDAYDFHVYESPQNVANEFPTYQRMFNQYGYPKAIWSTETGLNSGGMPRYDVALDMVKKFAVFFAGGGANLSWFDLFYPDPEGKGNDGDSFDVIDARYLQYAPKLTGVTNFDLINSICIKKFVEQKQYGDDIRAFLFRDRDNHQLEILWKGKGRQDAYIPLAGVQQLQVIRLDGEHRSLQPDGKGVTLSIGEEPMLLLYDGDTPLAEKLRQPAATLGAMPDIVSGVPVDISVNQASPSSKIDLIVPPTWQKQRTANKGGCTFTLTCPADSNARQANFIVTIDDNQQRVGELYLRPTVTSQVSGRILPEPLAGGKAPGVKLLVKNNSRTEQSVSWRMALDHQLPVVKGQNAATAPIGDTHFAGVSSGQATIPGGAEKEFVVPLAAIDSQTAYSIRADVTDASGRDIVAQRYVAGFVAVPKATSPAGKIRELTAPEWKTAPVQHIDEARQYFSFDPKRASWKGPGQLSATLRFLWDNNYLYVAVDETDSIFGGSTHQDDSIWQQDGLQFLIDPCRAMAESAGKYDYALGVGKKGPQTWCFLSADDSAPPGNVPEIGIAAKRKDTTTGDMTYVVAFPWSRLAPFKPAIGADLGLSMLINNDDGIGRLSYMTWFGNASTKETAGTGDLILCP